jgi:hypothetical protein
MVIIWKTATYAKPDNSILFGINFLVRPVRTSLWRTLILKAHHEHSAALRDLLLRPSPQIQLSDPSETLPHIRQGCFMSVHSVYMDRSLSEQEDISRRRRKPRKAVVRRFFVCNFRLLGEKSTRFMSRNCQRAVRSKNYNFTGFGENVLQILDCKVGASRAIGRAESEKL